MLSPLHASRLVAVIIAGTSLSNIARGAIAVTNWTMTTTTIDFQISGTIDITPVGAGFTRLYIGINDDTDWVEASPTVGDPGNVITELGGTTIPINQSLSNRYFAYDGDVVLSQDGGDFVILTFSEDIIQGDFINYQVHLEGGSLIPANLNPEDMAVTVGYEDLGSGWLNSNVVGTVSLVPEPSTSVLVGVFGLCALGLRRRAF